MRRQVFSHIRIVLLVSACTVGCTTSEARSVSHFPDIRVPQWPLSTKSEEARRHIERGEVYRAASYPDAAYDEFERAAAADSSLGYAYAVLSLSAPSNADAGLNLVAAQARVAKASPVERALIAHVIAMQQNDVGGMANAANELISLAPRNPRSWSALASADSAAGRIADARAALRKAIDADTTYAASYFSLGRSFILAKPQDLTQAERAIEIGVRLWPSEPVSYFALGDLRRAQGRSDDAIVAYSRAIALDPRDGEWYNLRAHAEVFAGQYARARADYGTAILRFPPSARVAPAARRALIPTYRGQPDSSLAELREVESAIDGLRLTDPGNDKAFVLSAELSVAVRHGRFDIARHADSLAGPLIRSVMAAFGASGIRFADASAALQHGLVAVYSGDYPAASHFADEIVRLRGADSDPLKEQPAHFLRGEAARLQHDYPRALAELALADSNGVAIPATYSRALALEAMGRRDEARAIYQTIADYHFASVDNASVHYDAVQRLAAMK